jgi:hypothetical protein
MEPITGSTPSSVATPSQAWVRVNWIQAPHDPKALGARMGYGPGDSNGQYRYRAVSRDLAPTSANAQEQQYPRGMPCMACKGAGVQIPQLHSPSAQVKQSSAHPLRRLTARRFAYPVTPLRYPDAGHLAGGLTVYLHSVTDDALTTPAAPRPPRPTRTFG